MSQTLQYERPHLYPKQLAALFNPKRYALVEASSKAGKTVACIIWLTEQALQGKRGQNFWWIAPSYFQANIAFQRLCNSITPGIFTANKTDLSVAFVNGAFVYFKSGEMPDKLYGEDVFAAVVDEASRVREEAWVALRSTLTATRGPARIIGNVKGRKNWFYKLARVAEKGHPEMHYAKLTMFDAIEAGIFPAEEAENARSMMSEQTFRELYMAEPADDGGNPFGGDEVISKCVQPEVLWDNQPICWGWDLAKSHDWTVGTALDRQGQTCRHYRWQKPWQETIADILRLTGSVPALVDATGVGDPILEALQRSGAARAKNFQGFKFSASSKQQLMEGLAVGIQRQEVGFIDNPTGIELRSFEYQYTRSGVQYGAPSGEHDDCVCSLALAWKLWKKPESPEWLQKALSWRPPAHLPIFQR